MKTKKERKKKSHKSNKKKIGTKLITNTKKLKLKIQSTVWNFKNIMLKKKEKKERKRKRKKKKNKVTKIIKNIYMKFA